MPAFTALLTILTLKRRTLSLPPADANLRWHLGLEPLAKASDLFVGPLSVTRHRAVFQPLQDVLGVRTDVVIAPQIEGEDHRIPVARAKQWPNVSRETWRGIVG
jgi:hypothetical protein